MNRLLRMRLIYSALFLTFTALEIYIALYVRDSFVRPYLGDVLAVMVVYFLIRTIFPEKIRLLPLWVFLLAVCIELCQCFQLVDVFHIQNPALRILLGSVFDWKDILCYGIGCIPPGIWEYVQTRKK